MNRREWLKLASGAVLAPFVAAQAAEPWDVIVLGAGMAGLSAAGWLRKKKYRVVVLEARDRVGGRVWTDHTLGFPVDMGAAWIHESKGNPITGLCRDAGIKTIVDQDEWQYLRPDGIPLGDKAGDDMDRLQSLVEKQGRKNPAQSQRQAAVTAMAGHTLSQREQWLMREFYHGCATETGALAEDVSVLAFRDGGYTGPDLMFPGGYGQLPQSLARGTNVQFRQVVKEVAWDKSGVTVATTSARWRARCAIVTLPLGVLQSGDVKFVPGLPDSQKEALQSLKMGLLNKVVLRFSKPFWSNEYQHFANLSQDFGVLGEIVNLQALFGHPALLLFLAGRPAWQHEASGDEQLQKESLALLQRLFPKSSPQLRSGLVTRWGRDPYARGCYSYLPPGVSRAARSQLAAPAPPLFFAGEATHRSLSASVHGAHLSGLRAAAELDDAWK